MALLDLVNLLFQVLYVALLLRVILSWVPGALDHPATVVLQRITDPILNPIRRLIPPVGGFDISPIIAFLVLQVLRRIVIELLVGIVL